VDRSRGFYTFLGTLPTHTNSPRQSAAFCVDITILRMYTRMHHAARTLTQSQIACTDYCMYMYMSGYTSPPSYMTFAYGGGAETADV